MFRTDIIKRIIPFKAKRSGGAFTVSGLAVAWNGVSWLAGGSGSATIASSSDGISWSSVTNSISAQCNQICYNGSLWIAVGSGTNQVIYSSNGTTWTPSSSANAILTTSGNACASRTVMPIIGTSRITTFNSMNKVEIQITYAGNSVTPASFTVAPSSFVSSISISGNGLILNNVARGTPNYVAVKSKQMKANLNNLPVSSVVECLMVPNSTTFEVGHDAANNQLIFFDASSTSFRITASDVSTITAPQVKINLYY